jgi:hypothetical protein
MIFTFHSWVNMYWKFIYLIDLGYMIPKELVKPQSQIPNIYFRKENNKFKEHYISSNMKYESFAQFYLEKYSPLCWRWLAASTYIVLCFSTEYHGTPTKRQVSKRPVSKRLKRQVYKTSGFQNVRFTKCQVYKTSGLQNIRLQKTSINILYLWLVEICRLCCSHVCRQRDGCVLFFIFEVFCHISPLWLVISKNDKYKYFLFNKYIKFKNWTFWNHLFWNLTFWNRTFWNLMFETWRFETWRFLGVPIS